MFAALLRARRALFAFPALLLLASSLLNGCAAPPAAQTSAALQPVAIGGAGAPHPPLRGLAFPKASAQESTTPLLPTATAQAGEAAGQPSQPSSAAFAPADQPAPLSLPTPTPGAPAAPAAPPADWQADGPVQIALAPDLPGDLADAWRAALEANTALEGDGGTQPLALTAAADDANARIEIARASSAAHALATRYYAAVVPFDTVQDDITLDDLAARWGGEGAVYTSDDALAWLPAILGGPGDATAAIAARDLIGALEEDRDAIGVIPFEQLDPRFKVLTVDGVNVLSNTLQIDDYPLAVQAQVQGEAAAQIYARLTAAQPPTTNRDPSQLTTLVMTGVTAMARGTAAAIERAGDPAYPAEIIGPTLAEADITHVSNEIPFLEGCEVNNTENNLTLCSDPSYWAALELMGTDIVGLSGNHVNDFGRDGARESLGWYKEHNIPVYGSGLTVDSACAPLLWEHNGNTFAFIAALAYDPASAWVTDTEPGACYYYDHKDRIISTIATLSKAVDIVAVELQYEETYFPYPTPSQVEEFRALRAAGADIVTGVQSHVPQAQEPYGQFDEGGRGFISYGLGNLYFDQMWSWETRTELYIRHAIYNGAVISTEVLTGVLEDFAQPRWATPDERTDILTTIFGGAPARP